MMYQALPPEESLSQGDVLDDCPLDRVGIAGDANGRDEDPFRWTARVVVLTQACDVARSKTTKLLVAMLQPVSELVAKGILKPATVRDHIRRGLVYGWYFLPTAPEPIDLPESIIDLRELHTVPRAILERLIADAKRVCRIVTPYREHLAQHFAVTYMRIGLPAPYETEP